MVRQFRVAHKLTSNIRQPLTDIRGYLFTVLMRTHNFAFRLKSVLVEEVPFFGTIRLRNERAENK